MILIDADAKLILKLGKNCLSYIIAKDNNQNF